jgi:FHS family L-fucose permease-like MFS transporter
MVGRFIGVGVLRRVSTGAAVAVCAIVTSLLVVTSMLTNGHLAVAAILLVGLFNSIMFPSIFTLGTAHMGPLTGKASGLLVQAIVGGAIIPVAQGAIADRIGIHHCFILPLLCYLFIIYYGFRGSRPTGPSVDLVATD